LIQRGSVFVAVIMPVCLVFLLTLALLLFYSLLLVTHFSNRLIILEKLDGTSSV